MTGKVEIPKLRATRAGAAACACGRTAGAGPCAAACTLLCGALLVIAFVLGAWLPSAAYAESASRSEQTGAGPGTVTVEMPLIQAGNLGTSRALSAAFSASSKTAESGTVSASSSSSASLGKATRNKLVKRFTQAVESMKTVKSARVVDVSSLKIESSTANDRKIALLLGDIVNFHPEYFYVSSRLSLTKRSDGRYGTLTLSYSYKFKTLKKRLKACEEGLADLLSWAPADGTELQKVKAVHDWLVRNCTYDANAEYDTDRCSPYNIYGALVTHKPVCQGYSLTFLLAMQQLGIDARCVGQYIGQQGHMWNRVKVAGHWYHVDLTFDDPLYDVALPIYQDGGFYATPSTKYFMKSDAWWKKHASSGGWHKSWYPKGTAGKDTSYDSKSDWETYRRAADSPSAQTAQIVDLDEVAKGTKLTLGSGKTSAVYKVTGEGTVSYHSCQLAKGKTEAKVPNSVQFKGQAFKVTGISAGAFAHRADVQTVTVTAKGLAEKKVKGCFQGSKVRLVKVPASKKALYKAFFAKSNSGRSVKVRSL